ncbi:hypothetical protein [Streptomyces flavofungini]|uniref:hypothetical protein n=1 Tax=Streptomyces flavofungini TaxID=68200 RepID=UPI0019860D74|nr:hypothetical protein [Streptomyces flavofungini]GHC88874.1 hypothetical protein GCM10010349_76390 [Streptomyces flavofungini]
MGKARLVACAVLVSATSGWGTRAARPGCLLLAAAFTGGLATIGFGLSGQVAVAVVMLAIGGAAGTVYEILEYALVQHSTPDRLRGRVVGVITTQGTTGDVVGDAEVAVVARWFSPAGAAVVNGAVCAGAAVLVAVCVPGLRRAWLLVPGVPEPGVPVPAAPEQDAPVPEVPVPAVLEAAAPGHDGPATEPRP